MLLDLFFSRHVKTCISKHRFQVWWLSSSLCPLSAQKWSEGDHKKNRPRCWLQIFVGSPNWWSQEIWFFSGTMGEGWVGLLCFILYSKSCCIKICIDWSCEETWPVYIIRDNCIRITQILVCCTFWWILLLSPFWRTIAGGTGNCLQRHLYVCQVVFLVGRFWQWQVNVQKKSDTVP